MVALCFDASGADLKTIDGVTEPIMDVMLGSPAAGIIQTERVKEGDIVKQGDVLLELDQKLEELEADRRAAVMNQNKRQWESTRSLSETSQSVSKLDLAKAQAEYEISATEHKIAVEELARRRIVAPFAGVVAEIELHAGAPCAASQTVVRLVDTSRCYFVGQAEGASVVSLHVGQTVSIDVAGVAGPVSGRICFVAPVVDPASGLARVKAIFDNADGKVRPGLTAKLTVE
jgi:RND family efflux transporter MFP subunit